MLKEVECDKINAVTTVETGAKTEMELIQSFSVDHTLIVPGIFTSRVDSLGEYSVTTYDIRLKRPNREPVIDVAAMHSLEHIIATYLRNDPDWKNEVIYWGPMGCLTGFYLILKGNRTPQAPLRKIADTTVCIILKWQNGMQESLSPILKQIPVTVQSLNILRLNVLLLRTDSTSMIHDLRMMFLSAKTAV